MNIKNYLLISALVVSIDAVYLKMVSNYFDLQIKKIQGSSLQLSIIPAILCYQKENDTYIPDEIHNNSNKDELNDFFNKCEELL